MTPSQQRPVRIGTRGSPLALAQAVETQARLRAAHGLPEAAVEIVVIKTSGDRIQDRALAEAGGKGLFTKEIEEALLAGGIDLAVHSAKDVPTWLPEGLMLAAFLPREDARDALIARGGATLASLGRGAVVGSASLRRQALLKRARPDLQVTLLRGNVHTRIDKVRGGALEATLLALAGLKRLGLAGEVSEILAVERFLPAVGQGAIALETRAADSATRDLLAPLHDAATGIALLAERAFLAVLDGSCRTPIAGHGRLLDGRLVFEGLIAKPDGSAAEACRIDGAPEDAEALGREAGRRLLERAGPHFLHA